MNQNLEALIEDHANIMADQMVKAVEWAGSEEDIRHEVNKLIDEFIKKAGMTVKGRHEYGLAGGRIDSKYGGVVIEYKDPKGAGKITENKNAPGVKAVVKQITKRFKDLQSVEHVGIERIFGVGCDGDTFVFVRHRGKTLEVEDPQPVTPHTVQRLLRAIVSLGARGLSFTPENLAAYFGSESTSAQEGVRLIHDLIHETDSPKAQTFFRQWQILFGEVCGYDIHGQSAKVNKLADHYHVPDPNPAELLFAVHTYYAIFMKMLAAEIVASFSPLGTSTLKKLVSAPTSAKLRNELRNLEQGGIWSQLGIRNFLEGDLFSWYLDAWNDGCADAVRAMTQSLDQFDPTTLSVDPAESRDLLKQLYQQLFPKSVRHDLGEYYTPDWLAELVLDELGYDGNPDKRLLDPACGSGTFLVMALNRVKSWYDEHRHECGFGEDELLRKVLRNIIGFDLNPLAVMAARTNYLMAIRDLLRHAGNVELPVYLCDSIMTPSEYGDLFTGRLGNVRQLKTSAGDFNIPTEVAGNREHIGRYADTLESCIRNRYSPEEFLERCEAEGIPATEAELHKELYRDLQRLDADNQNGIWARIIKNAFAPLFIGKVDYVAGNPPWIRYGYLPGRYREDTAHIWHQYGLFSLTGYEARLGSGEKDFSQLFVYVCIDSYLANNGRLGFVITQTVFRSGGQAEGFRRFRVGDGSHFQVKRILDLAKTKPFEGASNLTAVFTCTKGRKTSYPIPYEVWSAKGSRNIPTSAALDEVLASVNRKSLMASPAENKDGSRLMIFDEHIGKIVEKVSGPSYYTAHIGARTDPYGVYQIKVLQRLSNSAVLIENVHAAGKRSIERFEGSIEDYFLYPLVRGRDAKRWAINPKYAVLMVQDPEKRIGYEEKWMKENYPKTYRYLLHFRDVLLQRGSRVVRELMKRGPFYSMFAISKETFADHKVIWPRMGTEMRASVVTKANLKPLGNKCVIPCDTVSMVSFNSREEADFFCGCLNSSIARYLISSFSPSGRGYGSPSILKNISIPEYDMGSGLHRGMSELSKSCHKAAIGGNEDSIGALEFEIDNMTARLWGITTDSLRAIQDALAET